MNEKGDHIILVGMSASGKTSLGEALSIALNIPFIDTDEEIEKKTGFSISEIFNLKGRLNFVHTNKELYVSLLISLKALLPLGEVCLATTIIWM